MTATPAHDLLRRPVRTALGWILFAAIVIAGLAAVAITAGADTIVKEFL